MHGRAPSAITKTMLGAWFVCCVSALWGAEAADADRAALARYDASIKPADRKHWAFQLLRRPEVPKVKDSTWVRNPIDRFILARLEARGLKPAPAAEPLAALRRLHLDLIGIPPTIAQLESFRRDPSAEEWARRIESLLANPGHGERWGRHWLDLVRYAETNGYERDAAKPHAWRYRDWVIGAFNGDMPFDRFILEQLAGDELPGASGDSLIATGYYRLGPWDDEPADVQEDRFDQLDDLVSTTSQVFLGLTLGCARCHNHKFEPLTMHDYYRMIAIFNTLQRPRNGRTELDQPLGTRAQVEQVLERDRKLSHLARRQVQSRKRSIGPVVGWLGMNTVPTSLAPAWLAMSHRDMLARDQLAARSAEKEIRALRQSTPELPRGYFLREPSPKPPDTHLLIRGQASRPGPRVEPGVPAVLVSRQPHFLAANEYTSQRRLSLAQWIASDQNPLTARVIVNRVWQFHFGEGLVRTPSDFGTMGTAPTHPELLDWLTDEFIRQGWSLKSLHRLILTSNTYRMNKRWNAEAGKADPENRLLWRFPYRRLEVEAIRDSMLAVSGQLNSTMFGPSMLPAVPVAALEGSSDPDKIWKPSSEREASRRTIYAFVKRSMIVPMLEVLDFCDTARSSARRNVTSVAPQALTLFNGGFVNDQAAHLADRLRKEAGPDPNRQVDLAYRLALSRLPTPSERNAILRFLDEESRAQIRESRADPEASRRKALIQMCRALFNCNEFAYAD